MVGRLFDIWYGRVICYSSWGLPSARAMRVPHIFEAYAHNIYNILLHTASPVTTHCESKLHMANMLIEGIGISIKSIQILVVL